MKYERVEHDGKYLGPYALVVMTEKKLQFSGCMMAKVSYISLMAWLMHRLPKSQIGVIFDMDGTIHHCLGHKNGMEHFYSEYKGKNIRDVFGIELGADFWEDDEN